MSCCSRLNINLTTSEAMSPRGRADDANRLISELTWSRIHIKTFASSGRGQNRFCELERAAGTASAIVCREAEFWNKIECLRSSCNSRVGVVYVLN